MSKRILIVQKIPNKREESLLIKVHSFDDYGFENHKRFMFSFMDNNLIINKNTMMRRKLVLIESKFD